MTESIQARPTADQVRLSEHAVEQYRSRVKPDLDPDAARTELERLVSAGEVTPVEPEWVNAARPAPYYLLLSDAYALPLQPAGDGWIATTCVANLTLTTTRRAAKSARKAALGSRQRAQRRTRR